MYDRLRKGMTQTLPLYGTLPREREQAPVLYCFANNPNHRPQHSRPRNLSGRYRNRQHHYNKNRPSQV